MREYNDKNSGVNVGEIKTSQRNRQLKKHVCMMTRDDKVLLKNDLSNIKKLNTHNHLKRKIQRENMPFRLQNVINTLARLDIDNNIIEYNETIDGKNNRIVQRVLLRLSDKYKIKGKEYNCFVVICLTSKYIITTYFNLIGDNHKTLNKSLYCPKLKVRRLKKGGYPLSTWQEQTD